MSVCRGWVLTRGLPKNCVRTREEDGGLVKALRQQHALAGLEAFHNRWRQQAVDQAVNLLEAAEPRGLLFSRLLAPWLCLR